MKLLDLSVCRGQSKSILGETSLLSGRPDEKEKVSGMEPVRRVHSSADQLRFWYRSENVSIVRGNR